MDGYHAWYKSALWIIAAEQLVMPGTYIGVTGGEAYGP